MSSIATSTGKVTIRLIEVIVISVCTGVIVSLIASTPDFDRTHRYPTALRAPLVDLCAIAGADFDGGRLGVHLSILPDGRYSFFRTGCTGVGDRESGHVQNVGGTSMLSPVGPIRSLAERTLVPIRWGTRCYLVPPERMQDFCDAIVDGDEPRDAGQGRFSLDRVDHVDGVPDLPEPWAGYVRKDLVIGTIVEVMEGGQVQVDLGSADGIQEGSVLAVQGRGRYSPRYVKVTTAQEHSSVVAEPSRRLSDPPLEVGRKVVMLRGPVR